MNKWRTEHKYRKLIEHIQDGVFVIEKSELLYVNNALAEMIGYPPDELVGSPFINYIAPEFRETAIERYTTPKAAEEPSASYEIQLLHKNGIERVDVFLSIGAVKEGGGYVSVGSIRDITNYKMMIKQLEASEEELKSILDNLPDVLYRTDMKGVITMMSQSSFEAIGYHPEEMIGRPMSDFYATQDERIKVAQAIKDGGGKVRQVEAAMRRKDGQIIWVSTNAFLRTDKNGVPQYLEGLSRDITERKEMEMDLMKLARTDTLTGLHNRRYFLERATESLKQAGRYKRPLSLLLIDIDLFKIINDSFGHQMGDRALEVFAEQILDVIRETDYMGRIGGEEFAVVLTETTINEGVKLAERMRHTIEKSLLNVEGTDISMTISIGIVEYNHDSQEDIKSLLAKADNALYYAKRTGRNKVETYTPGGSAQIQPQEA